MIPLTRLNNSSLILNSDLVKFVEQAPDTVITLVNGEKILVRESADEVLGRIVTFRRSILQGIFPLTDHVASNVPASIDRRPITAKEPSER